MSTADILALVTIAGAIIGLLFELRAGGGEPDGWSAGPIIDGKDYSEGTVADSTGSFDFQQGPPGVHYVTKACGPLSGKSQVRLRYRIDAAPGTSFVFVPDATMRTRGPTPYFQQAGDDWSGEGKFETYRWFAEFAAQSPIEPGDFEIVAPLNDPRWKAVEATTAGSNPAAFADALAHVARVGFTFGGIVGAGHGVYATAKARFTVLEFSIEAAP